LRIETDEGVPILFYATHACRENVNPRIVAIGTNGEMEMTHDKIHILPADGQPMFLSSGYAAAKRCAMMDNVLAWIRGDRSAFVCDLDMAIKQTMVVSAIHESCAIQNVQAKTDALKDRQQITVIPGIENSLRHAFSSEIPLVIPDGNPTSQSVQDDASAPLAIH
jgi:hypothetical protein